jgi:hypothetical protein
VNTPGSIKELASSIMSMTQFDSLPLDESVQSMILVFNNTNDTPLNGEFLRQGYLYTNALRNIKTAGVQILAVFVIMMVSLILSEVFVRPGR